MCACSEKNLISNILYFMNGEVKQKPLDDPAIKTSVAKTGFSHKSKNVDYLPQRHTAYKGVLVNLVICLKQVSSECFVFVFSK